MAAADLSRRFLIDICKDGTISYRDTELRPRPPRLNNSALPVFSVNTLEQAETFQLTFGRRQYAEHPERKGQPWYRLSRLEDGTDPALRGDGSLEFEDLDGLTRMFNKFWGKLA